MMHVGVLGPILAAGRSSAGLSESRGPAPGPVARASCAHVTVAAHVPGGGFPGRDHAPP